MATRTINLYPSFIGFTFGKYTLVVMLRGISFDSVLQRVFLSL